MLLLYSIGGLLNKIEIRLKEGRPYKFVTIDHTTKTITFTKERKSRGGVTMSINFFSQYIQEHSITEYRVING